jgi:hypothetical protein
MIAIIGNKVTDVRLMKFWLSLISLEIATLITLMRKWPANSRQRRRDLVCLHAAKVMYPKGPTKLMWTMSLKCDLLKHNKFNPTIFLSRVEFIVPHDPLPTVYPE